MTAALREAIAVRIPMGKGAYEAVIVRLREGDLVGLGEAALVPGRDRAQAQAAAEECALLDLEARRQGVPMAELLGGARREGVECSALIASRRPPDVAREVAAARERGFRVFKLKSVNGGGPVDAERLGAARYSAGHEGRLRVDFNGSLRLPQALSVLPSLARFGLELVEQPLPPSASAGEWVRLAALGVPLAADESLADPALSGQLKGAGIKLAVKLATVGGPRAALALGPDTIGSSYETSIGIAAALHTACALPAAPLACGLATRAWLDGDVATGLSLDGAYLRLPPGPGLGVELDEAALERYRVLER